MPITLSRSLSGNFDTSVAHEWLITNGIGGFACGTVSEVNTRRYHGLLIAALQAPVGRTLLVAKLDVDVRYLGRKYALYSNEYGDGTVEPRGFIHLQSFHLDNGLPVWRYAIADALLEKRLIMQPGGNTTLIRIEILRASADLQLTLTPLCTYRDYHHHSHGGNWKPGVNALPNGFDIEAFLGAKRYHIVCDQGKALGDPAWHWRFRHRLEAARGLDELEDLYRPGHLEVTLSEKDQVTVTMTDDPSFAGDFTTTQQQIATTQRRWLSHLPASAPDWIRQLARAANQFVVTRQQSGQRPGKTVIAGYPWFTDWGRDTMIALPGLTLALGHLDPASDILRTFAGHLSDGMLPNRFPDQDTTPAYNTVDATLWFVYAVDQFTRYSGNVSLARELFPALTDIIDWHVRGTRYGIKVDPQDGLLEAGEPGLQLTWMDAKVEDWVVTSRIGKCVEINALWYHALMVVTELAEHFGHAQQADTFRNLAQRAVQGFQRFWHAERQCLFDVIDGDEGGLHADGRYYDDRLRPNQLFAVSLPHSPLSDWQNKAVVDLCARELLTSFGLRSLATTESGFVPRYGGDQKQRDAAYHQGIVWAWLIGPFIDAHFRVYRDAEKALSFLDAFPLHLQEACLGQISEIFDGAPPFTARGCVAQAWSVAEVLRVWLKLHRLIKPPANLTVEAKQSP